MYGICWAIAVILCFGVIFGLLKVGLDLGLVRFRLVGFLGFVFGFVGLILCLVLLAVGCCVVFGRFGLIVYSSWCSFAYFGLFALVLLGW